MVSVHGFSDSGSIIIRLVHLSSYQGEAPSLFAHRKQACCCQFGRACRIIFVVSHLRTALHFAQGHLFVTFELPFPSFSLHIFLQSLQTQTTHPEEQVCVLVIRMSLKRKIHLFLLIGEICRATESRARAESPRQLSRLNIIFPFQEPGVADLTNGASSVIRIRRFLFPSVCETIVYSEVFFNFLPFLMFAVNTVGAFAFDYICQYEFNFQHLSLTYTEFQGRNKLF